MINERKRKQINEKVHLHLVSIDWRVRWITMTRDTRINEMTTSVPEKKEKVFSSSDTAESEMRVRLSDARDDWHVWARRQAKQQEEEEKKRGRESWKKVSEKLMLASPMMIVKCVKRERKARKRKRKNEWRKSIVSASANDRAMIRSWSCLHSANYICADVCWRRKKEGREGEIEIERASRLNEKRRRRRGRRERRKMAESDVSSFSR